MLVGAKVGRAVTKAKEKAAQAKTVKLEEAPSSRLLQSSIQDISLYV